jgi:hypothetical protein
MGLPVTLMTQIRTMGLEELKELNREIIDLIHEEIRIQERKAGRRFGIDDVVRFTCKDGFTVLKAKVISVNEKSLSAMELDGNGQVTHKRWLVAPSLCELVKKAA